jgi:S1-C subfamily serine protease
MFGRSSLIAPLLLALPLSLSAQDHRTFAFAEDDRGRIGLMVQLKANAERDKTGALVDDVIPDSPADKAGIEEGDLITKFNGVALGGIKSADEEESGPGRKLLSLARKLEPGDTVKLEYRHGSDTKQATLVAERLGPSWAGMRMRLPDLPPMPDMRRFEFGSGPEGFGLFYEHDVLGLQLVDVNPELGEYFGTKEGVLVVRSPKDSSTGLKAGDVILAIDGRSVQSASRAIRILQSYDPGEKPKLEVMRQKKRMTLTWTVPERKEGWHWRAPKHMESHSGEPAEAGQPAGGLRA